MKKTKLAILVVMALLAAGCGKIRTCYCSDSSYYDIIDTALYDSVLSNIDSFDFPIYDVLYPPSPRESAVECSYWNKRDTIYNAEWGIRDYYFFECQEK